MANTTSCTTERYFKCTNVQYIRAWSPHRSTLCNDVVQEPSKFELIAGAESGKPKLVLRVMRLDQIVLKYYSLSVDWSSAKQGNIYRNFVCERMIPPDQRRGSFP